jgi:hypothetical protein
MTYSVPLLLTCFSDMLNRLNIFTDGTIGGRGNAEIVLLRV